MSLDDHPQRWISWWTNDTVGDRRARVKLADLLSFTSGFTGEYNCPSQTLDGCVQTIYSGGCRFEPNTTYHYGGDHLQVAALMAINAGGYSKWIDLFTERVYTPTGATGSMLYTPGGSTNSRIAGGLLTSTNTYIQMFMGFYLPTLFNVTTLARMQVDRTQAPNVTIDSRPPGVDQIGLDWHYCGSFWYECNLPIFNATCANANIFSSPGAFGFSPSVDRVNDYWMVISQFEESAVEAVNFANANRAGIVRALNLIYGPPVAAPVTVAAPKAAPAPTAPLAPTAPVPPIASGPAPSGSIGPVASGGNFQAAFSYAVLFVLCVAGLMM